MKKIIIICFLLIFLIICGCNKSKVEISTENNNSELIENTDKQYVELTISDKDESLNEMSNDSTVESDMTSEFGIELSEAKNGQEPIMLMKSDGLLYPIKTIDGEFQAFVDSYEPVVIESGERIVLLSNIGVASYKATSDNQIVFPITFITEDIVKENALCPKYSRTLGGVSINRFTDYSKHDVSILEYNGFNIEDVRKDFRKGNIVDDLLFIEEINNRSVRDILSSKLQNGQYFIDDNIALFESFDNTWGETCYYIYSLNGESQPVHISGFAGIEYIDKTYEFGCEITYFDAVESLFTLTKNGYAEICADSVEPGEYVLRYSDGPYDHYMIVFEIKQ